MFHGQPEVGFFVFFPHFSMYLFTWVPSLLTWIPLLILSSEKPPTISPQPDGPYH
jgi:hypothetical protein